jgi:thiamine transporter
MRDNKVRIMAETGVAVALAIVLNFLPLWKMPQGGSVSLEMLPIFIIAFRWGGVPGMVAGLVYGLAQLAINPYIVHPVQLILDYPLPYMLVGLAGFIPLEKRQGSDRFVYLLLAVLLGGLARFLSHLISGAVFFGQYAPEGQNPWVYSAIYNSSYMLPSLLIAFIVILPLYKTLVLKNRD